MSHALYRKYRPQTFVDITGQEAVIRTLCAQLNADRTSHAYLFSGTRGTGKTTTARVFAKALNCTTRSAGTSEPCDTCGSCSDIVAGRSIDVIEMDAATHTGVDTVREHIIEQARTLPTRDRYKIFIIDEVHMLSTSSFNALLKTLEEPPAHIVYILATTELHKIPATVASRCQRFLFRPLPPAQMMEKMKRIAAAELVLIDDTVMSRIIAASGGAMRDAESLLGQLMAIEQGHITEQHADILLSPRHTTECVRMVEAVAAGRPEHALALIEQLHERGVDLLHLHDECITHAHELLVASVTKRLPEFLGIFGEQESEVILTAARGMRPAWLATCIDRLVATKQLHKSVGSPLVPLHVWIAQYASEMAPQQPATAPAPTTSSVPVPHTPVLTAPPPHPDKIRANWDEARVQLSAQMPSLGIILSSAQLTDVRGATAFISVPVSLYRDKLSEPAVRRNLEQSLSAGCDRLITATISCEPMTPSAAEAPLVSAALATFGGTVIN